MKTTRLTLLIAAAMMALPLRSLAVEPIQPQTRDELEHDVRTGMSLTGIWNATDKFSLDLGYTMLTTANISRLFRNQITVGASYTPWKPLRVGAGYSYIAQYSKSGKMTPRHRVFCYAEGTIRAGNWKFSIYEKFQMTHRAYETNPYSTSKNDLDLKSRFKASYTNLEHIEPYAFVELWNCFNEPSFYAEYDAASNTYSNYQFIGYNNAYITRIRTAIGLKWKITKHHSIDFSYMFDYCRKKDIDIDNEGTCLERYEWDNKLASNISLGYVFAF